MSQEFPWIQSYQEGIPALADYSEYSSLVDIFRKSCEKFSSYPAFTNMGVTINYGELKMYANQFASYLQHVLHVKKGDRVAIMCPNLLQYPVALFGALQAGATIVNVNPLYTPRELEHQLKDSGAETIVILKNFAHTLEKALPKTQIKHIIVTEIGDLFPLPKQLIVNFVIKYVKKMIPAYHLPSPHTFKAVLAKGAMEDYDEVTLDYQDHAFLQYTGGTTGLSKGAILTHENIVANVVQSILWISPLLVEGQEKIITALPLYHIFSLTANCMIFLAYGGENILITNPRDIPGFIKELKKHSFTSITGVNTLFNALLNHPQFKSLDFSHLKLGLAGGMALKGPVADHWQKVTGKVLTQAYGLTETSPAACINPMNAASFNGSVGLPISSTEVVIKDDKGTSLKIGEVGEICIKGPQVMKGYWQKPESTAEVMTKDDFFKTGDIGKLDENGFVYIVDRKKDMILVSGFNVYPNEIEEVVVHHPAILDCAAVGVADEKSGEVVKIFCVKKDSAITEEEVLKHCKKNLTGYKIPKYIEFRDELPKSNVGKVLRRMLKEENN
ncbi:MAG: AMP-binding protein [Proteobacteria bacterium]|nr:AMP-binding protein [Pseudomonadota bacterium]